MMDEMNAFTFPLYCCITVLDTVPSECYCFPKAFYQQYSGNQMYVRRSWLTPFVMQQLLAAAQQLLRDGLLNGRISKELTKDLSNVHFIATVVLIEIIK